VMFPVVTIRRLLRPPLNSSVLTILSTNLLLL